MILLGNHPENQTDTYYRHLKNSDAIQITDKELKNLESSNQDFVLFIGRPTCKYCRKFVPKLEKASENNNRKIYYIDSEKYLNSYLSDFRSKYDVKIVPTLIRIKNGKIVSKTIDGSQTTVNEIENILK